MNAKKCKALRREMGFRNMDPRQAAYVIEQKAIRIFPEYLVPVIAAFEWVMVPLRWPMYTYKLKPGCGRALYKKAKKLLDMERRLAV